MSLFDHVATYSPEDNKLRIYPGQRLDDELGERYQEFKAAGYKWAAKQECFVCPKWTPTAEDWALELAGEIGDEDYSCEERSADRAERFDGYRGKRLGEANGHADNYEAGPAVFAHHRREQAERQAAKADRQRGHALSQWSKAEYWQARTAGVIRHAIHRSSAPVRRSRLLRLESEQRKHVAEWENARTRYAAWQKVATTTAAESARRLAYALTNCSHSWREYVHPRTGRKTTLYSLMTDSADPITGHEAAALYLAATSNPADSPYYLRWATHYELRIEYEKAMLANEGGMVAEAEIEPGGWIRGVRTHSVFTDVARGEWHQVHGVHRSPATKRITSVKVMGTVGYSDPKPGLVTVNVERLGDNCYRPPTDDERAAFMAEQAAAKAAQVAAKPKQPSLLNPTDSDADRLQALWNAAAKAAHEDNNGRTWKCEFVPATVRRMTQAEYSRASKGCYSQVETRVLHDCGRLARRFTNMWTQEGESYDKSLGAVACKLRTAPPDDWSGGSPRRVIVITDKPRKPLPLDWEKLMAPTAGTLMQGTMATRGDDEGDTR